MAERTPTRGTFAFQPAQAQGTRRQSAVQIGQAGQVGGGQSRHGNVVSDPAQYSVNAGASIPVFLERLVEPVMQQRQQERTFAGFAAARAGQTMTEIAAEQPELTAIFGQSDFERGASLFYARKAVNDLTTEVSTNMADYAAMTPADATKAMWERAEQSKTGVRETDTAIDALLIDATDKLMPTITRAQIEYRSQTLIRGKLEGVSSSGDAYRAAIVQANANPETVDPRQLEELQADFLSGFGLVPGMSLEAQTSVVTQAARGFLANGNLAAYRAMAQGGSNSLLFQATGGDEATFGALQSAYYTASRRANNEHVGNSDEVQTAIGLFNSEREFRAFEGGAEVRERAEAINAMIARSVPGAEPFYDEDAIIQMESSYSGEQATEARRLEDRQFTREMEQWKLANDPNSPENVERRAAQDVANIQSYINRGDTSFTNYGKEKYDEVAMSMLRNDPVGTVGYLARLYQNQGQNGFLPRTAEDMVARARQNVSGGVDTPGFITTYQSWKRFSVDAAGRPTPNGMPAQAAYFGDMHQLFLSYDARVANGLPEAVAYEQVFNDPTNLPGAERQSLPAVATDQASDWEKAITHGSRWFGPSGTTPTSTGVLMQWAAPLAQDMQARNPSLSRQEALDAATAQLRSRNMLDRVGRWAWATPTKAPGMDDLLPDIPADRLGRALESVVDMHRNNMPRFAGVSRDAISIGHTGGTTYEDTEWYMVAYPQDGPSAGRPVTIRFTPADIRAADRRMRSTPQWGTGVPDLIN